MYGPNGSGKSSILYAPFVFKNVVVNHNQTVDTFFNLLFGNLGGFDQVVHLHDPNHRIEIEVTSEDESKTELIYGVSLGKKDGRFWIKLPEKIDLVLPVTFPYPINAQKQQVVKINEIEINVQWNGITASVSGQPQTTEAVEVTPKLLKTLNKCTEILRMLDIVPIKRGFSKPHYSASQMSPNYLLTEDEVATLLAVDSYLEGEVMAKFRNIFGKIFKVRPQMGTALFYLQVTDDFGMTNELINDGFGLNQTVYILTKVLRKNVTSILLEEPEIHLHPTAQNKLARIFAEIVKCRIP